MNFAEISEEAKVFPGEYLLHSPTNQVVLCGAFNRKENFEGKGCFPRAYLEHFIREHKSDLSSPKSTITLNGKIVKSFRAINTESIVDDLLRKFKVQPPETGHLFGRGRAHRMRTEALIKYLKS